MKIPLLKAKIIWVCDFYHDDDHEEIGHIVDSFNKGGDSYYLVVDSNGLTETVKPEEIRQILSLPFSLKK